MNTPAAVSIWQWLGGCCLLWLVACSTAPVLDTAVLESSPLKNQQLPAPQVVTGGQPTEAQLELLAAAGVRHVINLRGEQEYPFDEASKVAALGMAYHAIPVAGPAGVTSENAKQLDALLLQLQGQPVLVHCASGNRVGALVALAQAEIHNKDIESAIAEGRRWGLTRLEPLVRKHLAP